MYEFQPAGKEIVFWHKLIIDYNALNEAKTLFH